MKEIEYGDKLNDTIQLVSKNDINSSRSINRPIRGIISSVEDNESIISTIAKEFLNAAKETSGCFDCYEKLKKEELRTIINPFNKKTFLKIPSGMFMASKNGDNEKPKLYTIKPNTELAERRVANFFGFNLNELYNDIRIKATYENYKVKYAVDIDYTVVNDGKISYESQSFDAEDEFAILKKLYTSNALFKNKYSDLNIGLDYLIDVSDKSINKEYYAVVNDNNEITVEDNKNNGILICTFKFKEEEGTLVVDKDSSVINIVDEFKIVAEDDDLKEINDLFIV